MKVFKVGPYYTSLDQNYAEGLRAVVALTGPDPGAPVAVELTQEEWDRLRPHAVALADPAPSPDLAGRKED